MKVFPSENDIWKIFVEQERKKQKKRLIMWFFTNKLLLQPKRGVGADYLWRWKECPVQLQCPAPVNGD